MLISIPAYCNNAELDGELIQHTCIITKENTKEKKKTICTHGIFSPLLYGRCVGGLHIPPTLFIWPTDKNTYSTR